MMQLSQVSAAVNGQLIGDDAILNGIAINSREDCQGRLFVALKGDNFDAHDYIQQAVDAGAGAALVERRVDANVPEIKVADTHQALADLATWWRSQFVIPLIGVTGSVGKTTVKEMLGAIFAQLGQGVVTHGNLNNEIGVPLTLMRLAQDSRYAVVEMGMNQRGEISRISAMAKPTIALINNAAAAHLEGLGSVRGVAEAKGEIFEGLTTDGVAIINADDEYAPLWRQLASGHRLMTFGLSESADVWASYKAFDGGLKLTVHLAGKVKKITLNAIGEHSARNALAAIAAASAANIPFKMIKAGLQAYRPISGRLVPQKMGSITLIDDTYNANPMSMRAAIDVLAAYDKSLLIVGDMGELGAATNAEHMSLGQYAMQQGVDQLLACGQFAHLVAQGFGATAQHFTQQDELLTALPVDLSNTAVLVKGSRSARMENVVHAIQQKYNNAAALVGEQ